MADGKRAGLWGKGGRGQQCRRGRLQRRARGFALRGAFPDVRRGLWTAEEAQDYTHGEPVRPEPRQTPEVRPKFEDPTPRPLEETDPLARARLAVSNAKTIADCDRIRARAIELAESGEWTEEQAEEIKRLLFHRAEMLISEEVPA